MQLERIEKIKKILLSALFSGILGSFWLFIVFWLTADITIGFFIAVTTLGNVLMGTALLVAVFSVILDKLSEAMQKSKLAQSGVVAILIFVFVTIWILLDMFVFNAENYQQFTLSNIQYSFADSFLGYVPVLLSHTFAIPPIYAYFNKKN